MTRVKTTIENHFGLLLALACIGGLIIPSFDRLPNESAIAVLALLMFFSCYRLRDGGFRDIHWPAIGIFYITRYILLPPLLWWLTHLIAPDYAVGVFLLSVVPAGVSSPAIASIYGGAIASGFVIVILTQLATPLLIPLQFAWLGQFESGANASISPSPLALFTTMAWCIFLPIALYALVRHHRKSAAYCYRQSKFFSMLLIAFIIGLAIAKQREIILSGGPALVSAFVITLGCFICYIIFGWIIALRRPLPERITFAACSGFNNAALGVSLALLHFPPKVVLFVAVSEISWSLLPLMFRGWLKIANPAL